MKPARSPHSTPTLPTLSTKARHCSTTWSSVRTVVTISTSFMTAAGLKKCSPMTFSGRSVTMAHSITGSDEVVVDSTASSRSTGASSANSSRLISRSSATASMTTFDGARSAMSAVGVMRCSVETMSSSDTRPLSTMRCRDLETLATTASAFSLLRPRTMTSKPALAHTSTMPDAMVPVPSTPTVLQSAISSGSAAGRVSSSGTTLELPGSS